jgi:glycosyltransferase involved in cell wall biosynthesis
MRILWVKAGKLLPVDTGGKIRSYNILRHLASRYETTLLSYYPGGRDEAYEAALGVEFPGSVTVALGETGGVLRQALHYASRFPRRAPYSVSKFTAPEVKEQLARLLGRRSVDVVVCDFLAASLNFPERHAVPTVLFQHNVESALWRRQARYERSPLKRPIFEIEAAKMYRYERAALQRFRHIVAVSGHDRDLMTTMMPGASVTVVPTGVDVAMYRPDGAAPRSGSTVMFLGSMDWPANIDGVEFFCEQVWPRVIAVAPTARFQVVGRNPPPRIRRLASASVEIVGGVESVLPHLHAAAVFVVPLRIGGGTRLKIYEAMAAERAIVSTRVGAEGLDYRDGHDLLIADDAENFAGAVIELLKNPDRRGELGRAAGDTAARFDWSVVSRKFEAVLRHAIESAAAP